jgi:hypothetical protein
MQQQREQQQYQGFLRARQHMRHRLLPATLNRSSSSSSRRRRRQGSRQVGMLLG